MSSLLEALALGATAAASYWVAEKNARKALSGPLSEDLNISPEPKLPLQQVNTAGLIKMTVTATRERNNRRSQRADHTRELRDVGGHCWSEGADCAVVIC